VGLNSGEVVVRAIGNDLHGEDDAGVPSLSAHGLIGRLF
jgi:hypothetical protein